MEFFTLKEEIPSDEDPGNVSDASELSTSSVTSNSSGMSRDGTTLTLYHDDLAGNFNFSPSNASANSSDISNSSDSKSKFTEVRRSARKRKLKVRNIKIVLFVC